jgi:4-carboxymuconolactone decarboxylase
MSRIPYPTDEELSDEAKELLATMPPLNIARMFAGAPASFKALSELGQAILLYSQLDPRLREVAILAVARTSDSEYERLQHENVGRLVGMPEEEVRAAADGDVDALDEEARLVWRFAEQIASKVRADEDITAEILARFGRQQATELVVCCAFYSAVARIIETTGVELEDELPTANIDPDEYRDNG